MDDDEANREEVSGPKDPRAWAALGVLWLYAIARLVLGATRIVAWREACT